MKPKQKPEVISFHFVEEHDDGSEKNKIVVRIDGENYDVFFKEGHSFYNTKSKNRIFYFEDEEISFIELYTLFHKGYKAFIFKKTFRNEKAKRTLTPKEMYFFVRIDEIIYNLREEESKKWILNKQISKKKCKNTIETEKEEFEKKIKADSRLTLIHRNFEA